MGQVFYHRFVVRHVDMNIRLQAIIIQKPLGLKPRVGYRDVREASNAGASSTTITGRTVR
jgi:hypothetical protein